MERSRTTYAVLVSAVILLGLASRAYSPPLPWPVREYAGDALWALAAYLTVAFLFPRLPAGRVAASAGLFSLAVEVSQLYHAPWIDRVRQIRPAALLLGHGFLWSDLACYAAGVGVGALAEYYGVRLDCRQLTGTTGRNGRGHGAAGALTPGGRRAKRRARHRNRPQARGNWLEGERGGGRRRVDDDTRRDVLPPHTFND